jgi:hypothetical protein
VAGFCENGNEFDETFSGYQLRQASVLNQGFVVIVIIIIRELISKISSNLVAAKTKEHITAMNFRVP